MTDIMSYLDKKNSDDDAMRKIIASLKDGGIYKARPALIEYEYEMLNYMSMGGNPPENRDTINEGLTRIVEKYGEEETIAMLMIYFESKLAMSEPGFDPEQFLLHPRPMCKIETEYCQMLGTMYRQAGWDTVKEALGILNVSIESQKSTASKSEYDSLVAMEGFFNSLGGNVFGGVQKLIDAAKCLKEKGLLAAKEDVAEALVHMREITKFSSEKEDSGDPLVERAKFESRKRKTVERIEQIIDKLGLEPVEEHLTERLGDIASDMESPMLYPLKKTYVISGEMESAMIGLWGFDYGE